MTSLIFKYKLKATDTQHVKLYKGARIVSAKAVDDDIYIWAIVDINKPVEERTIVTCTTGFTFIKDDSKLKHIDTVIMDDGLVFHVFEETND